MKIVINNCYGGFGLSPLAIKRLAELNGQQAYFFAGLGEKRGPVALEIAEKAFSYSAYTVPNPDEVAGDTKDWYSWPIEQRQASNKAWGEITLDQRPANRADPKLIQVVEELGEKAAGNFAELKIIEIPDGTDWEIGEYDGMERVDEKHQSWS
jgi:hypothetical protein